MVYYPIHSLESPTTNKDNLLDTILTKEHRQSNHVTKSFCPDRCIDSLNHVDRSFTHVQRWPELVIEQDLGGRNKEARFPEILIRTFHKSNIT